MLFHIDNNGYFTPMRIYLRHGYEYVITKQFAISVLFPHLSAKKQQKILKRAKTMGVWNKPNDIFEPVTVPYTTCKKGCEHKFDDDYYGKNECYDNKVEYTREFLKIKLNDIPEDQKIKDTNGSYSVSIKVITSSLGHYI
jgi:hypothetical protein